jgi:replicative DNA helicase
MKMENYEAEAAVLGAVLLDGVLFKELVILEDHFHFAKHRKIYHAMKKVVAKGEPIDVVTVTTYLGDANEEVGGASYLLEMVESVVSTANLKHYERLLLDAYRIRKTREMSLHYASNPDEEGLEMLIKQLEDIQEVGVVKNEKTIQDYLLEIADEICHPKADYSGFLTSYEEFDAMTGGLQRGDLIILAARPSVGKTAFALNLAAGHCQNGGTSSIFSLEMGSKSLLQRMISCEGMINGQKWRSMTLSEDDYGSAIRAIGEISNWDLRIHEQKRTVTEIRSAIRREVNDNSNKKHMVVIDYLQLISPVVRRERRDLEVGEITRELKLLAVDLDIPIVLLSQLSRGVESRQDKRPMMSDLRESGNIEQDADLITFLYRDNYYNRKSEEGDKLEVIIGKQRNGPTGTVEMLFQKEYGRFVG